jgi:hypothetical protein
MMALVIKVDMPPLPTKSPPPKVITRGSGPVWSTGVVYPFLKNTPFYISLEGLGVKTANSFSCVYFPDGLASTKQQQWPAPTLLGIPDGNNDRTLLQINPPLKPTGPTPNAPIGTGGIVIQGTTATFGQGEIDIRVLPL